MWATETRRGGGDSRGENIVKLTAGTMVTLDLVPHNVKRFVVLYRVAPFRFTRFIILHEILKSASLFYITFSPQY